MYAREIFAYCMLSVLLLGWWDSADHCQLCCYGSWV